MTPYIVRPNPTILGDELGMRREPTRPVERRVDNFTEKFDATTLFFDALFSHRADQVLLLGPPFSNLLPAIENASFTALPSRVKCEFRTRTMDRHSQVWISVPSGTRQIVLEGQFGRVEVTPGNNLSGLFEGKRVLVTLSKNNELEWIKDWVRYNRDIHGANAVLFYDNQSTAYSPKDIIQALAEISGLEQVCVVPWPFKYGPVGIGYLDYWDSNFCQYGSLEHARWMFLQRAESVLNTDVDELVVSKRGESIFKAAESAWSGMVAFRGVWVFGFDDKTRRGTVQRPIRYTDFDYYLEPTSRRYLGLCKVTDVFPTPGGLLNTKWAVVPSKCPVNAQWAVHSIYSWRGLYTQMSIDSGFLYRHYREINDNWRGLTADWQLDRLQREAFDPKRFLYDSLARKSLERVAWDR